MSTQIEDAEVINESFDEVEMFGSKTARWYQIAARNETVELLEQGFNRICVKLPTGAGKTLTSGLIFSCPRLRKFLNKKEGEAVRILFIAHKHRLLSQAEQAYAEAEHVQLILQSAFSEIPQHILDAGWDVTVIDEAHHEAMMTIQYRLEQLSEHPIIGLTATPNRADGLLIKFDRIVEPISREQAVAEGWLAPTQLYSFVDAPEQDKTQILKDIIDHYGDRMGQSMMFVRTKREVAAMTDYLRRKGYKAISILSQSDKEVDRVLNDFSAGKYQFVVNCNKINEGVDVINCQSVILGRTFGSYPQLNQVIGRAARPDSDCRVWELINPLSGRNLDTTVVVGTPESHKLIYKFDGKWVEEEFEYTTSEELFGDDETLAGIQGVMNRPSIGMR